MPTPTSSPCPALSVPRSERRNVRVSANMSRGSSVAMYTRRASRRACSLPFTASLASCSAMTPRTTTTPIASRGLRAPATGAGTTTVAPPSTAFRGMAATALGATEAALARGAPVDAAMRVSAYNAAALYARLPVGSRGGLVPRIGRLVTWRAESPEGTASYGGKRAMRRLHSLLILGFGAVGAGALPGLAFAQSSPDAGAPATIGSPATSTTLPAADTAPKRLVTLAQAERAALEAQPQM